MSKIAVDKRAASSQTDVTSVAQADIQPDDFQLDSPAPFAPKTTIPSTPEFELESELLDLLTPFDHAAEQQEFFIPLGNAEQPEATPQIEFDGMAKPVHAVAVHNVHGDKTTQIVLQFQNANTLLESMEAQNVYVPYQCRDGYCGSCRTQKLSGEVAYLQEPMAWINDDEVLPCCCVPKTDLTLKLKG